MFTTVCECYYRTPRLQQRWDNTSHTRRREQIQRRSRPPWPIPVPETELAWTRQPFATHHINDDPVFQPVVCHSDIPLCEYILMDSLIQNRDHKRASCHAAFRGELFGTSGSLSLDNNEEYALVPSKSLIDRWSSVYTCESHRPSVFTGLPVGVGFSMLRIMHSF